MSHLKQYLSTRQACYLIARMGRERAAHHLAALYQLQADTVRTMLLSVDIWRMAE